MIQISALNDSSSDESDAELQFESTKEAQESDGFALYNKALGLQRAGSHHEAERVFHQLLNTRLLRYAKPPEDPEKPGGLVEPGLILKYSTYKNLGSIAFQRHDLNTAMENYLEAASLDSTDVTLWYKIGTVAVDLHHLPLARVAFQQGLTCNQKHWPCLDQLCTVLYALNDYATCLYYICKALERNHSYTKGLALRDQIFSEQPSFRKDSYHMFRHCHDSIHNARVNKEVADKVIKEALTLREKKRALQKKPESPVLKFLSPLKKYTWKNVGEQLIALYDHISDRIPELSIGCAIDVSVSLHPNQDEDQTETPMDVDKPTAAPTTQEAVPPTATVVAGDNQTPAAAQPTSEKSSNLEGDANNVPGVTQDQAQGTDGCQLLDARNVVEKEQGDAGVSQNESGHQQQEQQVQQLQQGEQEKPTSGEAPSAMEYDTTTQATTEPPQPVPMETETPPVVKEKKRRGPKRKREKRVDIEEPAAGKRRSARVRNTTKKKEEIVSVNYAELLQRFLPSSLTDSEVEEDGTSQDGTTGSQEETTQNAAPAQDNAGKPCESDTSDFTSTEEEDVKQFLEDHKDNSGILDLLHYFLVCLAEKYNLKWPPKLTAVYVKVFERLRKHCCFPDVLSSDASEQYRCGVGEMLLVFAELKLDQWLIARGKMPSHSSPKKAPSSRPPDCLADFPGQFFEEDMGYVEDLANLPPIVGEAWRTYAVRVNWMKSRFLILQGKPEMSIDFFDECTYLLTDVKAESDTNKAPMTVTLPNCVQDNVITKDKIEHQKESLERCQSLEEVQRLYRADDYKRVVQLLLPTVLQPSMAARNKPVGETQGSGRTLPERSAQLELLHQSLLKLEDYQQCIVCGSASLAETWQEYLAAKTGAAREEWTGLLIQILEALDRSMSQGISVITSVERIRLVQITSTLIAIVEHAMEGAETDSMQPLTTVLPWIVLYRLIKLQEDKLTAMRISTGSPRRSGSPVPMMSSSLMLLETAHEYLGRHSWCCNSEGALLKLYVSVLKSEREKFTEEESHPFQDDLQLALEQCFYCLYAHPNRRAKARHLQDHGVEEVPLKWEAAAFLFDYFKPKVVPEFDSYKANSMSADLESLFLKISKNIPDEENPTNTMDSVQAYMEGNSDKAPGLPQDKESERPVVKEIHYFLADFYFKNKEFGKAIKFYILDICVCPNRLDSWAGVALARGGRLDLKLNSCDSKTETPIYKNSVSALICFKRALEIDCTNLSLWIEYGSLAYTLHSHASRQLKQRVHLRLSDDNMELLRSKRKEMLDLAGHCFLKASECEGDGDGEEWLVQYMLGKVSEKQQTEPGVYLGHYLTAANHLHENEAKYPKKITYHNPPDLSLEALEMYFRLHSSILKLLETNSKEGTMDYGLLNEFVLKASETPFVNAKEKKNTDHSDMSSSEVESDGKSSSGRRSRLSSSGTPMSPAYMMTPQDHDYLGKKAKKRNVSQETASTETASEGEILSGDDTTNSSFSQSAGTAQLLKSLADIKNKDTTTTTTDTSTSEGLPTETESSQDESSPVETMATQGSRTWQVRMEVGAMKQGPKANVASDGTKSLGKETKVTSESETFGLVDPVSGEVAVPVAITKAPPKEDSTSEANVTSEDQQVTGESDSEPDIIDLISDSSESPVRRNPKLSKSVAERKEGSKMVAESKETATASGISEDPTLIDLTLDSSDGESLVATPPKRPLHDSPIKVSKAKTLSAARSSVVSKALGSSAAKPGAGTGDVFSKEHSIKKELLRSGDGDGGSDTKKDTNQAKGEPMDVDGSQKSVTEGAKEVDSIKPKDSKVDKPMEVDGTKEDNKTGQREIDKGDKGNASKPAAETTSSSGCERNSLIERCLTALGLCLSRFPQHYKSLYRLAHAYCSLESHKNLNWSRDLLMGTSLPWQQEDHMPSPALFGEHSKTKNLFQGIWRIPITEIDRSGSFSWHMYRSVLLLLEVLEILQDHVTLLQVAIKLGKIPEQGKKYLRDTDRQYLSQQSYQLCLAVLQHQIGEATKTEDEERKLSALLAAHKVWQCVQAGKLGGDAGLPENILRDAYVAYRGSQIETEPSVLEQAVHFCAYYNMVNKLPQTPTSQHGDLGFLGRSPKETWYGSPVRSSQSDTRVILPSSHDNKTTSEGGVSQDTGGSISQSGIRMSTQGGHGSSSLYSLPTTDFQGAYKESLMLKTKDAAKLVEQKKRVMSPTSMSSQMHSTKVAATQPKVAPQTKAVTFTGKVIPKLRTPSSMAHQPYKSKQLESGAAPAMVGQPMVKAPPSAKEATATTKPIVKLRTPSSMSQQSLKIKQAESSASPTVVGQPMYKASVSATVTSKSIPKLRTPSSSGHQPYKSKQLDSSAGPMVVGQTMSKSATVTSKPIAKLHTLSSTGHQQFKSTQSYGTATSVVAQPLSKTVTSKPIAKPHTLSSAGHQQFQSTQSRSTAPSVVGQPLFKAATVTSKPITKLHTLSSTGHQQYQSTQSRSMATSVVTQPMSKAATVTGKPITKLHTLPSTGHQQYQSTQSRSTATSVVTQPMSKAATVTGKPITKLHTLPSTGQQFQSAQSRITATSVVGQPMSKVATGTSRPVVKLRTLSSTGQQAFSSAHSDTSTAQSKYFASSKVQHSKPLAEKMKGESKILHQGGVSKQSSSSTLVDRRISPALTQTSLLQSSAAKTSVTTASPDVVQRLKEALGSRQLDSTSASGRSASKLSLHQKSAAHGEGAIGSHASRPIATVAMSQSSHTSHLMSTASLPASGQHAMHTHSEPRTGSHSNMPSSSGTMPVSGQGSHQKEEASKETSQKQANYISSFLSFLKK